MSRKQERPDSRPPSAGAFVTEIQTGDAVAQSVDLSLPDHVRQHVSAPLIAGYVLTKRIGEGAYGQVWHAWQVRTRKEVAVKVFIRRSGLDWLFLQREVERLTRLDKHAHVVTLLDATLDGDPPFYAMDLLERGSLAPFVDPSRPVSTEQAQDWMKQIAEALAYVHGRGLIHCDLKPANILVDDQDSLRLVDFGHSRVFTETTSAVGTLFFMAPEQATPAEPGKPAQPDVRWDIYALGATVYALLTGAPPHATAERMTELDHDPDLSTRMSHYQELVAREPLAFGARRPPPNVNREFWAIVCKCLERSPSRRYPTASDLLKDLRALDQKRPISPLASHRTYRLKKFIQRNPAQVALGLLVVVSIVSFTSAVWSLAKREAVQRRLAESERDRAVEAELQAETRRKQAETVTDFLQRMVASADPMEALGREITVREVLDRAAADLPARFADQPLVAAALRSTVGRTYRSLGVQDPAEAHLQAALDIRRRNLPPIHPDISESLIDLAALLQDKGDYDQAERQARDAVEMTRGLGIGNERRLAEALDQLARILQDRSDIASAEPLFRESLEIRRAKFGDRSVEFATGLEHLAFALHDKGEFAEAEEMLRQVIEIQKAALGPDHPLVADSQDSFGSILLTMGRFAEAEPLYGDALRIRKSVFGPDHPMVARSLNNLCVLMQYKDDLDRAETYCREALRVDTASRGANSPDVATEQVNLAAILVNKKEYAEAEALLRQALETYRNIYGAEHPPIEMPLMHLAMAREGLGDLAGAEQYYREALGHLANTGGLNRPQAATVLANLGGLLCEQGKFEEGVDDLRQAMKTLASTIGAEHWRTAETRCKLGVCFSQAKRYDEAQTELQGAYETLKSELGGNHERSRGAAKYLSEVYEALDRPTEAEEWRGRSTLR